MNILIANDDGIRAEGIRQLAGALSSRGTVYVVAPHQQRSASSHALSVHEPMVLQREPDFPYAEMAWSLSGTPADCVKLGLDILRRKGIEIDIVYAGINHGGNLGTDTMYSGTVSAAAEGVFVGYPAVAVSVCDNHPTHFEGACRLAAAVLDEALKTRGRGSVVSLNVPDLPVEQIKGVRAARLGTMVYDEWFEAVEETPEEALMEVPGEKPERTVYKYTGTPVKLETEASDIDIKLIGEGYATVSMIKYDLNDDEGLKKLKEWELTL